MDMLLNCIKKIVYFRSENNEYILCGTCFFINSKTAITARHVIKDKNNCYVEIDDKYYVFEYIFDLDNDIAIILLKDEYYLEKYLEINCSKILINELWESFGFPDIKSLNGERLQGYVSIPNTIESLEYDIDLKMDPNAGLVNYHCMSGSPIIIDGYVSAILIFKPQGISVGGLKLIKCINFFKQNKIKIYENYSPWFQLVKEKISHSKTNYILNRKTCINDLATYILHDSTLVVGKAGIGKSYLLKKLIEELVERGIPSLYFAIDSYVDKEEFKNTYNLKDGETLVEKIKKESSKLSDNVPIVIIFDSYDSARSEEIKSLFLHYISEITCELRNQCKIAVSARIYDAQMSPSLQDLFPKSELEIDGIKSRHFIIDSLDPTEISEVLAQLNISVDTVMGIPKKVLNILSIPFHLWLLGEVITENFNFQKITSELDLLDDFWQIKINGNEKDIFEYILNKMIIKMLEKKSLTINKMDVFEISMQDAWTKLFSRDILNYSNHSQNKITFSHNIIFDYSVYKLYLTLNENIEDYLLRNPFMAIFIRPSFSYLFNTLWSKDQTTFWRLTEILWENPETHYIVRALPISIFINNIEAFVDSQYLIDNYKNQNETYHRIFFGIFKAIGTLGDINNEIWFYIINELVDYLIENHIAIGIPVLDKASKSSDYNKLKCLGEIVRRLYHRICELNNPANSLWYRKVIANGLVPLLCKTYFTNITETNNILSKYLIIQDENEIDIDFLYCLCSYCDPIYEVDFDFISKLYFTINSIQVNSTEITQLGGSTVLIMNSNRKQDFGMCKFLLYNKISQFIDINSSKGLNLALDNLNLIIKEEKIKYRDFETLYINFRNINISIYSDDCIWWASNYLDENIGTYAKSIFTYFEKISQQNNQEEIEEFLNIFLNKSNSTFIWRELFLHAAKYPKIYSEIFYPLFLIKDIYLLRDFRYQLSIFLKSCNEEWSFEKQNYIFDLLQSIDNDEFSKSNKINLLSCLSINVLIQKIEDQAELNLIKNLEIEPDLRITEINYHESLHDKLKKSGIDIDENSTIFKALNELHDINTKLINCSITSNEALILLNSSKVLYDLILDRNICDNFEIYAWEELSSAISKSFLKDFVTEETYDFYKKIIKQIASLNIDNRIDKNFKGCNRGYVPTLNHYCVELILNLLSDRKDDEFINILYNLLSSKSESLRCMIAHKSCLLYKYNYSAMWDIMDTLIKDVCLYVRNDTLISLHNLVSIDSVKVSIFLQNHFINDVDFINNSNWILFYLFFNNIAEWPIKFIDNICKEPWLYEYNGPNGYITNLGEILRLTIINHNACTAHLIIQVLCKIEISLAEKVSSLNKCSKKEYDTNLQEEFKITYGALDWLIDTIYFKSGAIDKENSRNVLYETDYFNYINPLIESIIHWVSHDDHAVLSGSSIHSLIEMFNYYFIYNPDKIIEHLYFLYFSGRKVGYINDSLAEKEMISIMLKLFADYKIKLKDENFLSVVLKILDLFAESGTKPAIEFLWKLEEIYR